MLEATLRIEYPKVSINANFSVPAGTGLALMGASGTGKSSILNAIAGFGVPASSRICFNDQILDKLPPAKRPLTILFQAHNLFVHLDVWKNVAIGLDPRLRLSTSEKKIVETALEQVGLGGFAHRLPESLSGGQQQRVALARCIARDQPLLLLDEPFNGLDRARRQRLIAQIKHLQQKRNLTLVLSTHHQDEAEQLCEQIIDLDIRGK